MKNKKSLIEIIVYILSYLISNFYFLKQGMSGLDSALYSCIISLSVVFLVGISGDFYEKTIEEHRKNKKAKRLKKATVPKRRSLLRKIFAKLHLWSSHREWQKSNNARSIPVMQRKFKKWAKQNPEMAETIQVIISQMHQLAIDHDIFEAVVEDSEFGYKGKDSRKVFDHTASQIRQNFSDIYNLMLLAGANEGQATLKTIDLNALAWELNSNRTKLALLSELNTQIVRLVNQIDGTHDNVMTEAEIEALAILNAMRFSKAAGFAAEANANVQTDNEPAPGTTASTP